MRDLAERSLFQYGLLCLVTVLVEQFSAVVCVGETQVEIQVVGYNEKVYEAATICSQECVRRRGVNSKL